MKWRNHFLALFCIAIFVVFGVFYFRAWVVQKPFGIILFVGEGLSAGRIAPARIYAGGADTPLALDSLPYSALLKNYSNDFATPDAAAAATALATGRKTNNGSLGVDANGNVVENLFELARQAGRSVGLVTNATLTGPTAAGFYAHSNNQENGADLAKTLIEGAKLDVVLGGGGADFLPTTKGGNREDDRDLLLELRRAGFDLARTRAELEAVPRWRKPKLLGIFAPAELAFADEVEARRDQPALSDLVRRAIELLQFNRAGYLLVVDAGSIRKAAEQNNAERTMLETLELDRAIAVAQRYAGTKSAIVVCGDVAIGGLTLNGAPFRQDSGVAVVGLNSAGDPWLTWATGPKGLRSYGAERIQKPADNDAPVATSGPAIAPSDEPAAVYAEAAVNNVEDMVALGAGRGADRLHGIVDSTAVFQLIRDNL